MILRGVKLRNISCCAKSHNTISGESSAQHDTARNLTRRSIILRGVTLYCVESTATSSNFLHRPLKGQCYKSKYIFRLC